MQCEVILRLLWICFSMAPPLASKAHWPFHDHACEVLLSLPWIVSGLISAATNSLVRRIQQWPCHEGANACYATSGVVSMRSTSARQAPNVSQPLHVRGLTWLEMIISACKRSRQCHPTRPAPIRLERKCLSNIQRSQTIRTRIEVPQNLSQH